MLVTVLIHLVLAILLFFVVNWIGKHSSTFGYLQLSLRYREDAAPAFNFALKTLAPTVYIILVATFLYSIQRDAFVHHLWFVAIYYFAFRLLYNISFGRALLLDLWSQAFQAGFGIWASYLAYVHLIIRKHPLFPDIDSIGNQLWVVIALFLYAILNNVRTSPTGSVRRKNRYLRSRFRVLSALYGDLIQKQFPEKYQRLVAYAVLIYETFNRPWLARLVERVVFPWGSKTIGPIQVQTTEPLTDQEAVRLGLQRLHECFEATRQELSGKRSSRYHLIHSAVAKYNRDESYIDEVSYILHILWAQVAPEYRNEFEHSYNLPIEGDPPSSASAIPPLAEEGLPTTIE